MRLVTERLTAPGTIVTAADGQQEVAVNGAIWWPSRYSALVAALLRRGYPEAVARAMGLRLLPLVARETGRGKRERNANVGNMRPGAGVADPAGAPGWHGDYIRRTLGLYRAYDTLLDGATDFVDLLHNSNYGRYIGLIRDGDDVAAWYAAIIDAGYYPATAAEVAAARAQYASLYDEVRGMGLVYTPVAASASGGFWGFVVGLGLITVGVVVIGGKRGR